MKFMLMTALLVLTSVWLVVRIRNNKVADKQERLPKPKKANGQFSAVSLQYSEYSCDKAKEMTGQRFLASAAPRLPLPGCDKGDCRCQFSHHNDRRSISDRRSPFGGSHSGGTGSFQRERRSGIERRQKKNL